MIEDEINAIEAEIDGFEQFLTEVRDMSVTANRNAGSLLRNPSGPQIPYEKIEESYSRNVMLDSVPPFRYEKFALLKALDIADNDVQADMYDEFAMWDSTPHDRDVRRFVNSFGSSTAGSYIVQSLNKFGAMSINRRESMAKKLNNERLTVEKYRKRLGSIKRGMENGAGYEDSKEELEDLAMERQDDIEFFDDSPPLEAGIESENDYLFAGEEFTYPVLSDAITLLSELD